MNLRVEICHTKCVRTGSCTRLAPDHFEPGPDGKALVRQPGDRAAPDGVLSNLSDLDSNTIREAAMFCPPEAISVWDADTGEQFFP